MPGRKIGDRLEKNFKTFISQAQFNSSYEAQASLTKVSGGVPSTRILRHMIEKGKKFLVTTVTSETIVIRGNGPQNALTFCPCCATEVQMFKFDLAVAVSGITGSELVRKLQIGEVHATETDAGHLLICANSLWR